MEKYVVSFLQFVQQDEDRDVLVADAQELSDQFRVLLCFFLYVLEARLQNNQRLFVVQQRLLTLRYLHRDGEDLHEHFAG